MASNSTKFVKICEVCCISIDDEFFTKCKIPHCTTPYFHDDCIRMPLSLEKNTNWTCPRCTFQIETGYVAQVAIPTELPEGSYEVSYERSTIEPDVTENFPAIVQAENGTFEIETGHVAEVDIGTELPEGACKVSYERATTEPDVTENFPAIVQAENGTFEIETGYVAEVDIGTELPEGACKVSYERATTEPDVTENFPAIVQAENGDDSEAGSKPPSQFNELTDEISALRMQLAGMHERFQYLNTNLTYTSTKLDEVFDPVARPVVHARQMERCEMDILSIKNQMARFSESLKNQIELVGIPERKRENMYAMVGLAARKIGVRFHGNDIDWAARIGPRTLSESVNNLCRPLVVRFVHKFKRDQFLRAGKATRSLMTSDLNVNCVPRRVYINERLSREVRCLFHEARFRAKQHGFKFCWIQNNSVFVRKSEGYPAMRLLCQNDLNTMVGDDLTPERDATGNEPGTA